MPYSVQTLEINGVPVVKLKETGSLNGTEVTQAASDCIKALKSLPVKGYFLVDIQEVTLFGNLMTAITASLHMLRTVEAIANIAIIPSNPAAMFGATTVARILKHQYGIDIAFVKSQEEANKLIVPVV